MYPGQRGMSSLIGNFACSGGNRSGVYRMFPPVFMLACLTICLTISLNTLSCGLNLIAAIAHSDNGHIVSDFSSLPNDRYYLHILLDVISIFLLGMVNSLPLLGIECTHHYPLGLKYKSRIGSDS